MKKLIIASMILLPTQAFAGEWTHEITGSTDTFYGYSDLSERNEKKDNNNAVTNTTYLNMSGTYEADDETKLSLHLDTMIGFNKGSTAFNNGKWGKELYGIVDHKAGRLMVGETFNVAKQFHQGAPSISNFDLGDFISNPNWVSNKGVTKYATLNSTAINTDGVAPKITYITPEFHDTMVGFSYVPNIEDRRGITNPHAKYDNREGYIASIYNHQDFGKFDLHTSASYAKFRENDNDMSVGAKLEKGNWSLGSSYRKTYVDGKKDRIHQVALDPRAPALFDNYREGRAWDVGVGYEIGPYTATLSYMNSKSDNTDNEDDVVMFSNKYQLNKHVNIYAAAAHLTAQGENKAVENNNKGYAFITGFGLEF